jgi:ABC-type molybdate transport system substrate-binding protein
MTRFFASVLIVLTIGAATAAHSQDKTITVFAAASMKNALDDVDATFTTRRGVKVITRACTHKRLMSAFGGKAGVA